MLLSVRIPWVFLGSHHQKQHLSVNGAQIGLHTCNAFRNKIVPKSDKLLQIVSLPNNSCKQWCEQDSNDSVDCPQLQTKKILIVIISRFTKTFKALPMHLKTQIVTLLRYICMHEFDELALWNKGFACLPVWICSMQMMISLSLHAKQGRDRKVLLHWCSVWRKIFQDVPWANTKRG